MPGTMSGHVERVRELLAEDEELRGLAMARLDNPGILDVAEAVLDPNTMVTSGARALNESLGGLLALTDRRLLYVARTLVGRTRMRRGNECISIPLGSVRGARAKRGIGVGDARNLLSLTLRGSTMWVLLEGGELEFVEIKPLHMADVMTATILGGAPRT